jgi:hypothetical protein
MQGVEHMQTDFLTRAFVDTKTNEWETIHSIHQDDTNRKVVMTITMTALAGLSGYFVLSTFLSLPAEILSFSLPAVTVLTEFSNWDFSELSILALTTGLVGFVALSLMCEVPASILAFGLTALLFFYKNIGSAPEVASVSSAQREVNLSPEMQQLLQVGAQAINTIERNAQEVQARHNRDVEMRRREYRDLQARVDDANAELYQLEVGATPNITSRILELRGIISQVEHRKIQLGILGL